jgi:hypothetical protein
MSRCDRVLVCMCVAVVLLMTTQCQQVYAAKNVTIFTKNFRPFSYAPAQGGENIGYAISFVKKALGKVTFFFFVFHILTVGLFFFFGVCTRYLLLVGVFLSYLSQ